MTLFQIYNDFICNIFVFLAFDLYISYKNTYIKKDIYIPIKIIFFALWTIISIIPSIPYFKYIRILIDFLYVLLITHSSFTYRVSLLIKFKLFYIVFSITFALLHTLLTFDLVVYATNITYTHYVNMIDCFLVYVFLSMYIILKQLSRFPAGRTYKRHFLSVTGIIVLLLVVCSMFLGNTIISMEDLVPLFFSLLLTIALLCLSIYQKVVSVLEENMRTRIDADKNALQLEYAANVEDSLNKLSTLRHDFKNHLIILQGYASSDRKDELLDYIQRLTDDFSTASDLIKTPSRTLSALLNAKKTECDRAGVMFHYEGDFRTLTLSDYQLITILGNLLDNALTAAAKCDDGFIDLKLLTQASYLEIDCVNNHKEQIKMYRDIYITTKTIRPELHGLGLRSVRSVVEEMNGELEIDHTNDRFHVNILVPNYE